MLKRLQSALRTWLVPSPPAPIVAKPSAGFFSTHSPTAFGGPRRAESMEEWMRRISPIIFQRTIEDVGKTLTTVGMDGALQIAAVQYAEDSAPSLKGAYSFSGGAPMPAAQVGWYAAQSFIGYQYCAMLAQHWFIDKACTMPARDAIRNGYDVTRDDGEKLDPKIVNEFRKLDRRMKVKPNCVQAVRKARMFGVRVILFEVNNPDPQYYEKPFNADGVGPGQYKGISQVDPYWITPELDFDAAANPASIHFYEPTYWRINGKRYHRSHLVVLKTDEVPDVLKPTYFYGGIPLPQRLYERVYAAERTANEAPQLALTKRTTIVEGVDMVAAMANPASFEQRIQEWAYLRDNYGVRVSGANEKVAQFDTSLTDVDVVIMTQFQLCCSIVEVPATKMLGVQPKGFNATGEYEESNYHEMLESIQEHDMEQIIARHHLLCMYSYIAPKFQIPPFATGVSFADLDSETAKEAAERTGEEAERDLKLAQAGAIDGTDIRQRLINQKNGPYTGIESAEPDGPAPRSVVQPGAPSTAPNTPPGSVPSSAPATVAATTPAPSTATGDMQAAMDEAVVGVFQALAKWRF